MKNEVAHEARAEFLEGSSRTGVLVIHGFTGSTQSMRPVAYALHRAGFTVSLPRLKGHGTTPEDMATTGYKDWIKSVEDAYHELKTKVNNIFVLGLSMGGTLSLYIAENYAVKGITTINAAIQMPDEFAQVPNNPLIPEFINGIGSDIKKEGIKEWAYALTPKKCIAELVNLSDLVRNKLELIKVPALLFKSKNDHVVPPQNQNYIFNHIGTMNKTLIELENSYHVATLDNDAELIIQAATEFIKAHE